VKRFRRGGLLWVTFLIDHPFNSEFHHRRSIRLKDYDYSRAGAYYVTICVQQRMCLLGEIAAGEMRLNEAGRMVHTAWNELPGKYPGVEIDEFIVMPNHFHGSIVLNVGAGPCACPDPNDGQPRGVAPTGLSLPDVVHRFKSFTTAEYRNGVERLHWIAFPGRFWQRNYYEHIIRDEREMNAIREYVRFNPSKWEEDEENPGK
jgi:putative transposase